MRKTLTVPMVGDEDYKSALIGLARSRGVDMSVLVREAIDKTHGKALRPYIEFFAAQHDPQKDQRTNHNHTTQPQE